MACPSSALLHLYCFLTPDPGSTAAISLRLNKATTIWRREVSQDPFLSSQNCPYYFFLNLFMLNYFKCFSWELKVILLPHSVNQGKLPLKVLGLTFHLLESLMLMQSGIKTLLNKDGSDLIICWSAPGGVSYARVKTQWVVNVEQKKKSVMPWRNQVLDSRWGAKTDLCIYTRKEKGTSFPQCP